MPYYAQIETTSYGNLTVKCGTTDIADRLSNTNSTVAGPDFAYVYAYDLDITQPHNEHGAGTISAAPAVHTVVFTLPDYEPILSGALNILAGQDVIKQITFNISAIEKGAQKLLAQYTLTDGMLTEYEHVVDDQRAPEAQKQRGHVILTFKFKKIALANKITNTEGSLTTNAS